ncbi:ATP-binding protein [Falsarthrobacter nasiphocae]|uniref:Schlafen AlbA-2 domain-containing protein n=1 Tax=Falsarthrobacter nasiphocae TaxID=189863 RepID=A0AAE3YG22_9MICC|nr:ATP-binding protein [Falsarthrobacter nasiphocae]MDR6891356.1 hypothetical protein [Falsarthrobacter nasiphocae]
MVQQYLGPALGVVAFSTWSELEDAAEQGLLEESVWCELKEMPTPQSCSKKDANLEMARDLASLSVDGGLLIFGVRDNNFDVVGCDTQGLTDRISQVAGGRVYPPLSPTILPPLLNPEDESRSVLIVQVPPSPLAPHMVDGSYWGRSSNGKRKLNDTEVRRLLLQRDRGEDSFRQRLISMETNDPLSHYVEGHPTGNGHIYLVAEPCAPVARAGNERQGDEVLRKVTRASAWQGVVPKCVYRSPNPAGDAYATVGPHGERIPSRGERSLCHVLLHEDSSIEVVSGGGTATWESDSGQPINYLCAGLISTLVIQTLELVADRSRAWGYTGQWRVGLRVTKTRGAVYSTKDIMRRYPAFVADDYVRTTVIQGINTDPLEQAETLLRGLYRGLGIDSDPITEVAN